MLFKKIFIFILLFFPTIYLFGQNDLEISADFPGGNIIVENCDNKSTLYYQATSDTIKLRPDLRDTEGNWFYWYFRVTGAANRNLFFQFAGHPIGSFGPAYSTDGGKNWNWLHDKIQKNHSSFSFSFGENQDSVMFCMGIPYLQKNFDEFISGYRKNPYVSIHSLTKSEKGRDIEEIHICNPKIT
ncbi:MAG: M14-type cytosolic carboxypeptidase, partial [Draconibacterium sp.]|nr:M14-type cytosolic carboxypeptidase [Draconibacterium sp.]